MADNSAIEWTSRTWNMLTGCSKVSTGCKNCYAEKLSERLMKTMGRTGKYKNGFKLTQHHHLLDLPRRWRKPSLIFVNSMSDVFHEDVETEFLQDAFRVMSETPRHCYHILTKRPERALELAGELPWPDNVWMGASVENVRESWRAETLAHIPAAHRFLSCEPLLENVAPVLETGGIHWIIAGGESGPGFRPPQELWFTELRDLAAVNNIPFFFKQWGGIRPKSGGDLLEGIRHHENPCLDWLEEQKER